MARQKRQLAIGRTEEGDLIYRTTKQSGANGNGKSKERLSFWNRDGFATYAEYIADRNPLAFKQAQNDPTHPINAKIAKYDG